MILFAKLMFVDFIVEILFHLTDFTRVSIVRYFMSYWIDKYGSSASFSFIFLHFLHSSTSRTAHLEWANSHYLFGTPIIYSVNNYSFATRSLTPIPSLSFAVSVSLLLDYFLHTISLVLFLLAFVSLFLSLCLAFFVFVFVLLCVLSRSSSPHGVIVIGWFVTSMPASVWSGTSMKIMRNA